jgi:hypothetical protein
MSGSRGGSSNFGVRLSVDGAEAVEASLRRVQTTAAQVGQEVSRAGDSTGRALAVIERGTQAASAGLTKMGGDFAALAPVVDTAGGAIGRLVTSLSAGTGLLGVLGAVGGAVGVAVSLYQNWGSVTSALGGAIDTLTGRVRANVAAINDANGALRAYLQLSETALQAANRTFIAGQRENADSARGRLPALQQSERDLAAALERARAGGGAGRVIARGGASGLVPTDEFGQAADRAVQDRLAQQGQLEVGRIEGEIARVQAAIRGQQRIIDESEGRIAGAVADQSNGNPGRLPDTPSTPAARGGGGGGAARPVRDDLGGRRDAFLSQNDPFERYAATLSRIGQLQADLAAAGQSPLPDEAVVRATEQAMQDYERALSGAGASTRDLADGTKEWERASQGAAKALTGAFEDLVFEGQSFDDVLKNLERSLLRIGNQVLLQPLIQSGFSALFGGGGGNLNNGGTSGIGGLIGQGVGFLSSLVAHDGALVGAGGGHHRMVPASLFAGAPRFHGGGIIGPNEVPAILERGERVLSRAQAAAYSRGGGVTVNISTPDAGSFRNSQGQIMSTMAAALARSGRNR